MIPNPTNESTAAPVLAPPPGAQPPVPREPQSAPASAASGSAPASRGFLIFAGPAGGKTTLHFKYPTQVYDPEMLIDFRTQPTLGHSFMWEQTIDLVSLYFGVSVPVIMLALKCNRMAVSSCVAPQNAGLVRWLAEGLSQSFEVSVLRLTDEELEPRVAHRRREPEQRLLYIHGGYAHTQSTHMMLHSFTLSCPRIRLIDSEAFTQAPLRVAQASLARIPRDRLQVLVWEQKEANTLGPAPHVAIEVLPHLYVLCVEDRPRLLFALDLFATTRQLLVMECLPKTIACVRNHIQPCKLQLHVTSDAVQIHTLDRPAPVTAKLLESVRIDFLPTHKLRMPHKDVGKKCCVLAYYGTFAPIHRGHLETLQLAKEHAERIMSYHVVGAYVCPIPVVSTQKAGMLDPLLPWRQRAAIVDFVLEQVDYAMVDPYCYETAFSFDSHPMHTLRDRLAKSVGLEGVEVFWVNGTDIASYSITSEKLRHRGCRLLLVPRQGYEQARLPVDQEWIILTGQRQVLAHSSTQVRKLVSEGEFTKAGDIIGNRAALAYLLYLKHEGERTAQAQAATKVDPPPDPDACILS